MSEVHDSKEALPIRNPGRLETPEEARRDFKVNILTEDSEDWYEAFLWVLEDDEVSEPKPLSAEDFTIDEMDKLRQRVIDEGYLEKRYWWLRPEMQEAINNGRLKEQLSFFVGQKKMDFYCFDRELSQAEIDEIGSTLEQLSQIADGVGFDRVKSVVVTKNIPKKKHDGLTDKAKAVMGNPLKILPNMFMAGKADYAGSMIFIKDRRSRLMKHPLEGAPLTDVRRESYTNLAGTLAHEIGHHMQWAFDCEKWLENHGWNTVPGQELNQMLQRFTGLFGPSAYSGANPNEDFAETFKYFLLDPGKLDAKRLNFMLGEVLGKGEISQPINAKPSYRVLKRYGEEITLPRAAKQPMNFILTAVPSGEKNSHPTGHLFLQP